MVDSSPMMEVFTVFVLLALLTHLARSSERLFRLLRLPVRHSSIGGINIRFRASASDNIEPPAMKLFQTGPDAPEEPLVNQNAVDGGYAPAWENTRHSHAEVTVGTIRRMHIWSFLNDSKRYLLADGPGEASGRASDVELETCQKSRI